MVAWSTLIGGLLLFLTLTVVLFRRLFVAIKNRRIGTFVVIAAYWASLIASLFVIWLFCGVLANYIYSNFPLVWVASWDIGLAWVLLIGFWLSVAIGVFAASLFSWRVLHHATASRPL